MNLYYDREGQPISQDEWAGLLGHDEYRRVAETTIDDFWVSTVWLGLNHSLGGGKLIFETMVFTVGDGAIVDGPIRYATLTAAEAGHRWIVKKLKRRRDIGTV